MKRINKILCVVEPNTNSEAALLQAVKVANDHQADITVASLLKNTGALRTFYHDKNKIEKNLKESTENKRLTIENWVKKFQPSLNFKVDIYAGIGFIEIVRSVIQNQYDLLVKCADDVDWLGRLFGSDDMHLLRKCPCPVLMLKPGQKEVFRNVLAAIDVNDDFNDQDENRVQDQLNKKVLEYSSAFSVSELTDLHIGSAWEAFGEDFLRYGAFSQMPTEKVDHYAERIRQGCSDKLTFIVKEMNNLVGKDTVDYLCPKVHLVKGLPAKEIPLIAEKYNIDLIVMGTVARNGIPGFIIGNTAESILEQVQCSVLAIKPDGFQSPILGS